MNNIKVALAFILGVVIMIVIIGFPVMLLWNWLMPEIFGLTEITFIQAIGLLFLTYLFIPKQSYNSKTNS